MAKHDIQTKAHPEPPQCNTTFVTMTSTATTMTAPVLLLLLVVAITPAAATAAATNNLPATCLREAAALCQGSSTNAMACLTQLAAAGDARVSKTCATALDAIATKVAASAKEQQRAARSSRLRQLDFLLIEGGCLATGTVNSSNHQVNVGMTTTGLTCGQVCCNASGSANSNTVCCIHNNLSVSCAGAAAAAGFGGCQTA